MVLETRVLELTRENAILRAELYAIKDNFGLPLQQHFIDPDAVNLALPESACRGRRNKLLSTIIGGPNGPFIGTFNTVVNTHSRLIEA